MVESVLNRHGALHSIPSTKTHKQNTIKNKTGQGHGGAQPKSQLPRGLRQEDQKTEQVILCSETNHIRRPSKVTFPHAYDARLNYVVKGCVLYFSSVKIHFDFCNLIITL